MSAESFEGSVPLAFATAAKDAWISEAVIVIPLSVRAFNILAGSVTPLAIWAATALSLSDCNFSSAFFWVWAEIKSLNFCA